MVLAGMILTSGGNVARIEAWISAGLIDNLGWPLERMPHEVYPGANPVLFDEAGEVLFQRRVANGT